MDICYERRVCLNIQRATMRGESLSVSSMPLREESVQRVTTRGESPTLSSMPLWEESVRRINTGEITFGVWRATTRRECWACHYKRSPPRFPACHCEKRVLGVSLQEESPSVSSMSLREKESGVSSPIDIQTHCVSWAFSTVAFLSKELSKQC